MSLIDRPVKPSNKMKILRPVSPLPGFTWLEVLMTMAVLILGCLAVLNLQKTTANENYQPDHLTIVSFLAESQLEFLKAEGYEKLGTLKNKVTKVNRYGEQCREESDGACYQLVLNIEPERPNFHGRLIRLEIKWEGTSGPENKVFETALTDFTI